MLVHHEPLVLIGGAVAAGGSGDLGMRWVALGGALRRQGTVPGPRG